VISQKHGGKMHSDVCQRLDNPFLWMCKITKEKELY